MGTFLICYKTGTRLKQARPRFPASRANEECPHFFPPESERRKEFAHAHPRHPSNRVPFS